MGDDTERHTETDYCLTNLVRMYADYSGLVSLERHDDWIKVTLRDYPEAPAREMRIHVTVTITEPDKED